MSHAIHIELPEDPDDLKAMAALQIQALLMIQTGLGLSDPEMNVYMGLVEEVLIAAQEGLDMDSEFVQNRVEQALNLLLSRMHMTVHAMHTHDGEHDAF